MTVVKVLLSGPRICTIKYGYKLYVMISFKFYGKCVGVKMIFFTFT